MKKLVISTMLSLALITGCCGVPKEAPEQVKTNALITDSFILLMDGGRTTRQQEQNFIRANRKMWHALNYAINDVPLPADIAAETSR